MEENKSELIVREDGEIEVTKELIANIKKFQKAKLQLTLIETELKEGFKKVMEDNGIKKWTSPDGSFTVTYIAPTTSTTLDSKRLKAEMPEVYEAYSKTSAKSGYVKMS